MSEQRPAVFVVAGMDADHGFGPSVVVAGVFTDENAADAARRRLQATRRLMGLDVFPLWLDFDDDQEQPR